MMVYYRGLMIGKIGKLVYDSASNWIYIYIYMYTIYIYISCIYSFLHL